MVEFWKAAAAVLIASILTLVLDRQAKDFSVMLTMGVCTLVGIMALSFLEPVLDLLRELEKAGGMENNLLGVLLKAVGIGVASELISFICTDAGKGSLGKSIQMLGSAAILSLSVPVFRTLLQLIRQILGVL